MFYKVSILGILCMLLSGCNTSQYTEIKSILNDPAQYKSKEVKIHGRVSNVLVLPLLGTKTYKVKDGSGEITIVTKNALPNQGEMVTVIGNATNTISINGESFGLQIDEVKRQ